MKDVLVCLTMPDEVDHEFLVETMCDDLYYANRDSELGDQLELITVRIIKVSGEEQ